MRRGALLGPVSMDSLLVITSIVASGCCVTFDQDVSTQALLARGEEHRLTFTLERLDDVSGDAEIDIGLRDPPAGSEIRLELEPGMELVGTGESPTVRLDNLSRRLANCGGSCVFPLLATIADDGESGEVTLYASSDPRCGDPEIAGELQSR